MNHAAIFLLLISTAVSAPLDTEDRSAPLSVLLLSASKFAFNSRHSTGILALSAALRVRGVPEERLLLLMADEPAARAATIWPGAAAISSLEVSVGVAVNGRSARRRLARVAAASSRGATVSAAALLASLSGRLLPAIGPHMQLRCSNSMIGGCRLLFYATGHGGGAFLKLSDAEEVAARDVAAAVASGLRSGTWGSVTALLDTCQAASLAQEWRAPGGLAIASSIENENSLSMGVDFEGIGGSLGDGFSTLLADYLLPSAGSRSGLAVRRCMVAAPLQPAGPLSLAGAISWARGVGCGAKIAVTATKAFSLSSASPPTLADALAAIPAQRIGSSVVVLGSLTARLHFYANFLRRAQSATFGALDDVDIVTSTVTSNGSEPACTAVLAGWRVWKGSDENNIRSFMDHLHLCGSGTRGRLNLAATGKINLWTTVVYSSRVIARCRDLLALASACLGRELATDFGMQQLDNALLSSRFLADVLGELPSTVAFRNGHEKPA